MRIGIISTIGDCSWAGSEEMWKLFAIEALQRGHSVAAMLQTPISRSKELAEFRALGGVVFAYNPLNRYTSRTVRMGLAARQRVEQQFASELMTRRYLELYNRLLGDLE